MLADRHDGDQGDIPNTDWHSASSDVVDEIPRDQDMGETVLERLGRDPSWKNEK